MLAFCCQFLRPPCPSVSVLTPLSSPIHLSFLPFLSCPSAPDLVNLLVKPTMACPATPLQWWAEVRQL